MLVTTLQVIWMEFASFVEGAIALSRFPKIAHALVGPSSGVFDWLSCTVRVKMLFSTVASST